MPAVALRGLRPEVAAKLNRLEAGAAMLDRDVRNGHAVLVELGLLRAPRPPRLHAWRSAGAKSVLLLRSTARAASAALDPLRRLLRSPRLAAAWRMALGCTGDSLKFLTLAFATLLAFSLIILLVAPPV
jgi:hypothetical protein